MHVPPPLSQEGRGHVSPTPGGYSWNRAKWLTFTPEIRVNSPPTATRPRSAPTASMPRAVLTVGAHGSSAPVASSKAASFDRAADPGRPTQTQLLPGTGAQ